MTGPYADIAAELHSIADDLAALPGPVSDMNAYLSFSPPWRSRTDDEAAAMASVDRLAVALTGEPGKSATLHGTWQHGVEMNRGPVWVRVYCPIQDPTARDKDAEIKRLQQELAALREQRGESAADTAGGSS